MLARLAAGLLVLALAGCSEVYLSSGAGKDGEMPDVAVVELTPGVVARANATPFAPRALPAAFRATAGAPAGLRGAGALPAPVREPAAPPAALETRLPPAADPGPYRIGVGDVIALTLVPEVPVTTLPEGIDATRRFTVQDDGAITLPEAGRVPLEGLTLPEAEAALFEALIAAQLEPTFSIDVAEFNSQRVAVGGAVANPAVLTIGLTPLTLAEALSATGGIEAADREFTVIRIYRDGELYQIAAEDFGAGRDLQRVRLLGGDSVFVDTTYDFDRAEAYFEQRIRLTEARGRARAQAIAELEASVAIRRAALEESRRNFQSRLELGAEGRDWVYLTGEVIQPARFALPFESRAVLADALFGEARLISEEEGALQVYLIRGSGTLDRITAYWLDGRNAANFVLATRMELRPGDVIYVADQPISGWTGALREILAAP